MKADINQSNSIVIKPVPCGEPGRNYMLFIIIAMVFAGMLGSFISMLGRDFFRFSALFSGSIRIYGLREGMALIANRLFHVSEQNQAYRYTMFVINAQQSDWNRHVMEALGVISIVLAALCIALVRFKRGIFSIITMVLIACFQIYFGVFPSAAWNTILFTSLAMTLMRDGKRVSLRGSIIVITIAALLAVGIWAIYPGPNPTISEFSENIRDRFDIRISQITGTPIHFQEAGHNTAPEYHHLNIVDVQEDTLHEAPTQDYNTQYDERPQGAEIGALGPVASLVPLLIGIIALLIIIALARHIPRHLKVYKRRKQFETDPYPVAINNMFIYVLEWLSAHGLQQENLVFSAYTTKLAQLVSKEYSHEYENATAIWRKAVYSQHTPSKAERLAMQNFLNKTMNIVWKNASIRAKVRIKLHYFL
ncbi:MAG: hypothetical protein FWE42_05775 [Defluviitaleaceae bacterium]|nr:hypothetical protein [Defluviitaleaceae bacterium]